MCSSTSVCLCVCVVRVSHITILFSSRTMCAPVSATGPVSRSTRITPPKSMYPPHLYKQQGVVLIVLHAIFPFALAIFQHSPVYLFTVMRSNQRHTAPTSHWVVYKCIRIYIWSGLRVSTACAVSWFDLFRVHWYINTESLQTFVISDFIVETVSLERNNRDFTNDTAQNMVHKGKFWPRNARQKTWLRSTLSKFPWKLKTKLQQRIIVT